MRQEEIDAMKGGYDVQDHDDIELNDGHGDGSKDGSPTPKDQHTPGPWKRYIKSAKWGSSHLPMTSIMSDVESDFYLARVFGKTEEETDANAKLIAAAPDMLALLRKCRSWFDCLFCNDVGAVPHDTADAIDVLLDKLGGELNETPDKEIR